MSWQRSLVFSFVMLMAMAVSTAAPAPARAASEVKACGAVAVYMPATTLLSGVLTIGATPFVIAPGGTLDSSVGVGANLCFDLTLNLSGAITDATVTANASSTLALCGIVTEYTAATATVAGSLTTNGVTLEVAIGTPLPASVNVGADVCVALTLNGFGQISAASASANGTSTLDICGVVGAYGAATATSTGSLTVAGRTFVVAAWASLPAAVNVGADLCMRLTLNGFGQVSNGTAEANLTSTLEVCGQVTAYAAGTGTSNGSITIGGATRVIAAGTSLSASTSVNAYLNLRLRLDAFARITDAEVLKVGVSLADACGPSSIIPMVRPSLGVLPGPSRLPSPAALPRSSGLPAPDGSPASSGSPALSSRGPSDSPGPGASPGYSGSPEAKAGMQGTRKNVRVRAGEPALSASPTDSGQIVPDTASLGRAGMAVLQVSLPLLLLLAGLLARELVLRRRRLGISQQVPSVIAREASRD